MKTYLSFITLAIVCFAAFLSGCATAGKSDWKVLQEDAYHNRFSYDMKSVERTPAGTVKAWASSNGARYLYDIDCKNKKMRILEGHGADPAQWFDVLSNSGDQLLYNEVCQ
jgi:hypothetical protein